MSFTAVDLSQLPAPEIVQTLDFETILAAMVADLQSRDPSYIGILESDPAYKQLEVAAAREVIIRQRVNDAALGVMLAKAINGDLDQLGANNNTGRLANETDEAFRARIQLAHEALSTAGPIGSYIYHALSADAEVKDALPELTSPGVVTITLLSANGDGTVGQPLIDTVDAYLTDDDLRPLGDNVIVQGATISNYTVVATLEYGEGNSIVPENILQDAIDDVTEYTDQRHSMGKNVYRSGIIAALYQPGVTNVTLTSPAADITSAATEAPYCSGITVTRA